jgi:hypothetical protein
VSQSSQSQFGPGGDRADLRAQFEAEVVAADLTIPAEDREQLFAMWVEHLPQRNSLRAAIVAPEEEPSFTQKPAQPGAGITRPAGSGPQSGARLGGHR